jgi:hypothetical protein
MPRLLRDYSKRDAGDDEHDEPYPTLIHDPDFSCCEQGIALN